MKFIVVAGGQGTKLWPYSTDAVPKQFQKIIKDESLFSYTVNVLLKAYKPEDIFISTKKKYVKLGKKQAPDIPTENYIIEPDHPKGRGPGEGYAFFRMSLLHPDEPFMIIQPDCFRLPEEKFLWMVDEMEKAVRRDKKLISGGVKATYPILGIDYLRLGKRVSTDSTLELYEVEEFIERNNDYYKTKDVIRSFRVTTHSNHNCWYAPLMMEAYKEHAPDWYEAFMKMSEYIGKDNEEEKVEEIYSQMREGMTEEVTKHVFPEGYIVVLPFKWTDIGTWDSVYEFFSEDGETYIDGNAVIVDSKGSLIKSSNPKKLIAMVGLNDVVVVDTEDTLLIIPRDKVDDVKKIREKLKEKDLTQYL